MRADDGVPRPAAVPDDATGADVRPGVDTDGDGRTDTLLTAEGVDLLVHTDLDGDGLVDRVLQIGPDASVRVIPDPLGEEPEEVWAWRARSPDRRGVIDASRRGLGWRPMAPDRIDPAFRALPLDRLADAALSRARALGATHADVRIERIVSQSVDLRDGGVTSVIDATTVGSRCGSSSTARGASPRTSSSPPSGRWRRPSEPSGSRARWRRWRANGSSARTSRCTPGSSGARTTPSTRCPCPSRTRSRCWPTGRAACSTPTAWTMCRPGSPSSGRTSSTPTCAGTSTVQQRVRTAPVALTATTVDRGNGTFETMSSLAPPAGARLGVRHRHRVGLGRRDRAPARLARREGRGAVGRARPLRPGDRPVQPLADHPRVGGPRHRVRQGDRLRGRLRRHQLRHAGPPRQPALRLAAHARHRRPHGPARAGDDRLRRRRRRHQRSGTSCATAILVGYQLDRTFAPRLGLARSNGCAYADSPHHVPLQRMANVSLAARPDRRPHRRTTSSHDVDDGIYIVGRPFVVDRHAARQLPVHRAAVLPHPKRPNWPGSCATSPTRR